MGRGSFAEFDVLAMGRVGVDIYPLQDGALEGVTTFEKFLGGSPTNVAVAAARHGLKSSIITKVGNDPFGRFITTELNRLGVGTEFLGVTEDLNTPIAFCEIFPPDRFPLYFYREPTAPDLQIEVGDINVEAVSEARLLWITATGLSQEPSRSAHHAALNLRPTGSQTVLDLDFRSSFWESKDVARREIGQVLDKVSVVVGNQEECEIAVGESSPDQAADAILDRGISLAVVKLGPRGVLAKTRTERVEVAAHSVEVVNGLGAGDGFGGALCLGLLRQWPLRRMIQFANVAGSIVASRRECATAMPTTNEVLAILETLD